MALGISEASLQRAYAPTDWGSFYKGFDDVFVKAEKEKAAEQKLLNKEFYTTSATLAKDMGGIRTEDVPEVTKAYTIWKNAQQKMISNPNLISRDPEAYGKLNAEANEAYGLIGSLAAASKAKAKEIIGNTKLIASGQVHFEDNANTNYTKSHTGIPTSKLIETGADDITQFKFAGPDDKVTDTYNNGIRKGPENSKIGFTYILNTPDYKVGYQASVPNYDVLNEKTTEYVQRMPNPEKYATSFLSKNKGDFEAKTKEYNDWRANPDTDKELSQFVDEQGNEMYPLITHPDGVKSRAPYLKFDNPNNQSNFKSYLTAKGILQNKPEISKVNQISSWAGGEKAKKTWISNQAENMAMRLASIKQQYAQTNQANSQLANKNLLTGLKEMEGDYKIFSNVVGQDLKLDVMTGGVLDATKFENAMKLLNQAKGIVGLKPTTTKTATRTTTLYKTGK